MRHIMAIVTLASCLTGTGVVNAAELRVLTAGAFKPVVTALAAEFESTSGHKLSIDNDTAGALLRRIGVAVKEGVAKPSIATVAEFKASILAAGKVAYIDPAAGGSSGIYFAKLLETLGIADAVKSKAVLVPGGLVAERLVTGEADIAVHQISEILAVKGVTLVGPLPAEIQNFTTYAGGISAAAAEPDAAKAFLAFLGGEAGRRVLSAKGMEPGQR